MSESTPPRQSGEIHAPNPVELFWEKNRLIIITVVAVAILGFGFKYALRYMDQAEIDARWGGFATAANLDIQYASPELPAFFPLGLGIHQSFDYFTPGLITELGKHVGQADPKELTAAIAEAANTPAEPLLVWVAARRAMENQEWDEAVGYLTDLQARFPEHPLCASTAYPVQFRPTVENGEPADPPDPEETPELEPPVPGSQVEAALAQIERQKAFAASASKFYQPLDPPGGSPRVRVTTNWGDFTIALYEKRAPEHVEHFLQLVENGFYTDQNVDEIVRTTNQLLSGPAVQEFHFGLVGSKSQDRTEWDKTVPSEKILDFVDSPEQRELSHFPGTMSASPEADGRSSAERYWISVNDTAGANDGTRVIVGRVVQGMEIIELIVGLDFATDAEVQRERGRPRDNIRIEKIEKLF